jgi:hypothetical protein
MKADDRATTRSPQFLASTFNRSSTSPSEKCSSSSSRLRFTNGDTATDGGLWVGRARPHPPLAATREFTIFSLDVFPRQ